jgi:hypothetical protein
MALLVSNKLALRNPISEEIQNEFLSDCCRVVYYLEMTDHNAVIREQFNNWDDLVRFVKEAPIKFGIEDDLWSPSEFKIWTEMEDFSDKLNI